MTGLVAVGACQVGGHPESAHWSNEIALAATGQVEPIEPTPPGAVDEGPAGFRDILLNPTTDIAAGTRRWAADKIVALQTPEAYDVLAEGLRSGHVAVIEAVVDAMMADPHPARALMQPAVEALRDAGNGNGTTDDLARLIVRYGGEGLDAVAVVALDKSAPEAARLNAIAGLQAFRTHKAAAARLVELLGPRRDEPEAITRSACIALGRTTGLDFGDDPERWTRWWDRARDQSDEEWLASRVRTLTEQMTQLGRALDDENQRGDELERRLHETLRKFFPGRSYELQIEQLPPLLADDLAVVRQFAIGSIERLLRDSREIPPELVASLAERLDDPVPALRIEAAELLDQLAPEDTAVRVTRRLEREDDPAVAAVLLMLLANHPHPDALPVINRWLAEPTMAAAADAVWGQCDRDELPATTLTPEQLRATRDAVLLAWQSGPDDEAARSIVRVLACLADDEGVETLIPMLDGDNPALRDAVAEGLARAGRRRPLIDRASNEAIYPHAVTVLQRGTRDLDQARRLVRLTPPEAHYERWADAVRAMCADLIPVSVLSVDEMLRAADADAALRRSILEPAATLPAEAITPELRAEFVVRMTPVLFDLGDADRAHELLAVLDLDTAQLRSLRFQAAVRAGKFDEAAAIDNEPVQWIAVLETLVPHEVDAATRLAVAINDRFPGLAGELKSRFEKARAQISVPRATSGLSAGADTE